MSERKRIVLLAAGVFILVGGGLTYAQVKASDVTRLERARKAHTTLVTRATERYQSAVQEANEQLTKSYQQVISDYEAGGDAATVELLKKELEASLATVALADESGVAGGAVSGKGHADLIRMLGPTLMSADKQPMKSSSLAGVPHVLLYFSAEWCPPCRAFTPKLVEFFNQQKESQRVMVIFVSSDNSEADMYKYMSGYNMAFPAVPFKQIKRSGIEDKYAGKGIPNLVLLNADGSVRSGSYVDGKYVGPNKVLNDLKALLESESAMLPASSDVVVQR